MNTSAETTDAPTRPLSTEDVIAGKHFPHEDQPGAIAERIARVAN